MPISDATVEGQDRANYLALLNQDRKFCACLLAPVKSGARVVAPRGVSGSCVLPLDESDRSRHAGTSRLHTLHQEDGIGKSVMNPRVAFGLSVLLSLLSSIVATTLFVWPWLRAINNEQAVIWLVAPHMFLRFVGLSFLVPGVVSGSLPKVWAIPAGYGDFVAGILRLAV